MGKRSSKQAELWVASQKLKSPGHPFYQALNRLLHEANFDTEVELLCRPYFKDDGRPSTPPGVYFRMLMVGYFENIDSQRGIAWRCADSLSLKDFLGLAVDERVPDHSNLTRMRQRLPFEVHEEVFEMVLGIASDKKLLHAKTVAVDSTYVEANAAMKSIVRKDTKEKYAEYARRLAEEEGGLEQPNDEEVRRFDRKRKNKKVSNKDWESPADAESRIVRMKDGRTRLGYKFEHAVDLDSDLLVGAEVYSGDEADSKTLLETLDRSRQHLRGTGRRKSFKIEEVVADKGYHSTENLVELRKQTQRSYIPEAERPHGRRWKPGMEEAKQAVYANRRRVRRNKGRKLQKQRSEKTERTFVHVCDQGGGRRSWLRGLREIAKYHFVRCAARNLGVILRSILGFGKPKVANESMRASCLALLALLRVLLYRLVTQLEFVRSDCRSRSWDRTPRTYAA
ncbi:MAG TPA: transposase [Polyangiales bacterium]|nr:transposase [Polyangiales bacterium]